MLEEEHPIELWLEYEKSDGVEFQVSIKKIRQGSVSEIAEEIILNESDLEKAFVIPGESKGYLAISILARGQGFLN